MSRLERATSRFRAVTGYFSQQSQLKTAVLEVLLICLWAAWVGRPYLNLDPRLIPAGNEFNSVIQAHHLWTQFAKCGLCALWNGAMRGGFPAFVDTHASALHPLVIITTLFFGVANGAKLSLVFSFIMAGLAQLWLGYELQLSRLPRLWAALLVIVAGHLTGKMDLGVFSLVLSTATFSLTLPAALRLSRDPTPRNSVILAMTLALLIVSGQGYIQIGFIGMLPAYLPLLVYASSAANQNSIRAFMLAGCLGLLLAAPFLVPFLHFWPNFNKDADPYFSAGQPLPYYILNLVIDNRDYFFSNQLGKLPYPYLYVMFIGWIPASLAVLTLYYGRKEEQRPLFFLFFNAVLALVIGSGLLFKWLFPLFPTLATIRFFPVIGGMAVPCLVALAGYSLNRLWQLPWKTTFYVALVREEAAAISGTHLSPKWLLLFPLLVALWQGYNFSRFWVYAVPIPDDVYNLLEALKTPTLQWVQPPFGEHVYIEPAIEMGLKLSPGIMAWRWEGRPFPTASLEADRHGQLPNADLDKMVADISIWRHNTDPYATVSAGDEKVECAATGAGGWITVLCNADFAGKLTILENSWSGWWAWRDGERQPLQPGQWLAVQAPEGKHTYTFRYLPWDVLVGVLLFGVGCYLSAYLWRPIRKP